MSDRKTKIVGDLITNGHGGWKEEHRATLLFLSEEQLENIQKSSTPTPAPVANTVPAPAPAPALPAPGLTSTTQAPMPMSADEYIRQAPEGIRQVLMNGVSAYNAEKEQLVTIILQKAPNVYHEQKLRSMDVADLRPIATLANGGALPVVNYSGAQGAPVSLVPPTTPPGKKQEPLIRPKMEFATK